MLDGQATRTVNGCAKLFGVNVGVARGPLVFDLHVPRIVTPEEVEAVCPQALETRETRVGI